MTEKRFLKYVKHTNNSADPDEFLKTNIEFLSELEKDPETQKELNYYKALGNDLRFKIFKVLENSPMCTCALAKIFKKKENLINHHLKILESYGIIKGIKDGYFMIYSLS